jgi:hypothetical protein
MSEPTAVPEEPPKPIEKEEKPSPVRADTLGSEIGLFANQIDALAETLPLARVAIEGAISASRSQLAQFLKQECTVVKVEGKQTTYNIADGQLGKYQRFARRMHKADLATTLVPRGLLVALVSQFDAYVGALIRQLFKLRPEIVGDSAKSLTFAEMSKFESIDAARDYVIESEIESVLRESHSEQFDWLEKKFGVPLRKELPAWPIFVEVTERRNLFVHTNGIVSRQYLQVCGRNSCQIPAGTSVGQALPLTAEYFEHAYQCIFEIGVKLGQVLWRKMVPGEMAKADLNLAIITFDLITEGHYRLARVLLDFATETLKKHSSEENRLVLVVNRAQTYKWMGDEEGCRKIVDAQDWSATSQKFKLAQAVLRDNFKEANDFVRQIGANDAELNKHTYREGPLFKGLRKDQDFSALFQELFGEPLNKVVVQDPKATGSTSEQVN